MSRSAILHFLSSNLIYGTHFSTLKICRKSLTKDSFLSNSKVKSQKFQNPVKIVHIQLVLILFPLQYGWKVLWPYFSAMRNLPGDYFWEKKCLYKKKGNLTSKLVMNRTMHKRGSRPLWYLKGHSGQSHL